ncbi:MAG: hypothetical protein GX366_02005 [Epulopiscium sp.]|nr:hypothetical protein [Candidatus Epulonipiscium sp.]
MDKKFKVFVILAFVLLFAGMVVGGFFIVTSLSTKDMPPSSEQVEGNINPKNVEIFQLEGDITTNLVSEEDKDSKHVIKITVGFAVNKKSKDFKEVAKQFSEKEILIRNEVIEILRNQSYESMAKADAQETLSEIIVSRLSTLLFTQSIEDMYFGDFFVQ